MDKASDDRRADKASDDRHADKASDDHHADKASDDHRLHTDHTPITHRSHTHTHTDHTHRSYTHSVMFDVFKLRVGITRSKVFFCFFFGAGLFCLVLMSLNSGWGSLKVK